MRLFIMLLCLFPYWSSYGQLKKLNLEVDLGLAYSFKLNDTKKMRTNNGIAFFRPIYKGYKYPSIRSRFSVGRPINPYFDINLSLGVTFRFMEPWEQSSYTYFSFPLSFGSKLNFLKFKNQRGVYFFNNIGYHFKHQKYRYQDDAGGIIASVGIGSKNSKQSISYNIGYEFEQDRSFRRVSGYPTSTSPSFDYQYNQFVSQVYLSIALRLF